MILSIKPQRGGKITGVRLNKEGYLENESGGGNGCNVIRENENVNYTIKWNGKRRKYYIESKIREDITNKGYSNELSKHMSQEVFRTTNIYNAYPMDNKKTYKVNFSLKEDSRIKIKGIVYVKMTYSVEIMDSNNILVGGSSHIPIKFTIKNIKGEWYITDKYEPA